ncbi:MAG: DUF6502 family protein [Pseudomonadota bacterium]
MTSDTPPDTGFSNRYLSMLLRPLARVLIARGITAPAFYKIVKKAYVDVAGEELGPEATDSRITIATGVHRRDVKIIRTADAQVPDPTGQKISMLATVVGRWMSLPEFRTAEGPKPLPRTSDTGSSFDALVQSVSRDVRPRAVLDELERRGIVRVDESMIVLQADGLVGSADVGQKTHFFAHNVGDHLNAAADNLLQPSTPHLERAVFYNALTEASVSQIEAEARALGLEALQKINTLAAELQAADADQADNAHRVRFGVFFYQTNDDRENRGLAKDADE